MLSVDAELMRGEKAWQGMVGHQGLRNAGLLQGNVPVDDGEATHSMLVSKGFAMIRCLCIGMEWHRQQENDIEG